MKPTSTSYWHPDSGIRSEPTMTPEPGWPSSPPARRLSALLSCLGIFLVLLLAGQGCGNNPSATDQSELAFERGLEAARRHDDDHAIAEFSEAIRLKPDHSLAYYNRANAYSDKGDYDKAIADYNEAIRLNPNFVEAHYTRGVFYVHKGGYDKAIADYIEAIHLKPD